MTHDYFFKFTELGGEVVKKSWQICYGVTTKEWIQMGEFRESWKTKLRKGISMFFCGRKKLKEQITNTVWDAAKKYIDMKLKDYNKELTIMRMVCKQYKYTCLWQSYNNSEEQREELEKKGYTLAGCVSEGECQVWIKKKEKD